MSYILSHADKIYGILLLLVMSIGIRMLLQILGQRWITTIAHTSTLVMLPILTYIITSVISGNIALSLGMVGALSIVRFRNPVRSPLELSVYFAAITMGIAASVSLTWLAFLAGSIVLAAIVLACLHWSSKLFFKSPFFTTSFSEGNSMSTLDITATSEIEELDFSDSLTLKSVSPDEINYILTSTNFNELIKTQKTYSSDSRITFYQLNR